MSASFNEKLVVAISSRALFDLDESLASTSERVSMPTLST